jgi:hypothetical protein
MRYTVVWWPVAEAQLARLWVQATDRQAVTDASNRIDRVLRDDPDKKGTPQGRFRVLTVHPLMVLFHVDPGDCMVRVISVKRTS